MTLLTALLLATLPAAARPADTAALPVVDEQSARDTRERLREIFKTYPPSVAQVLRLDPSLITKPAAASTLATTHGLPILLALAAGLVLAPLARYFTLADE